MQTTLDSAYEGTKDGESAKAILRKCVHCGFCTATCPTYQLLGDELDGPRGRIYLIKQVLEGAPVTRATQVHLDRCLTCRNCETTCPSGVAYGQLVDIGRHIVDRRVERPLREKAVRWVLKEGLTSPLFPPAMKVGKWLRPMLPKVMKDKVPSSEGTSRAWPSTEHARKVLMLGGCVQPSMLPNINRATARVLDRAGIQTVVARDEGCCGALRSHLGDRDGGLDDMRRNIDAWWPFIEAGTVEAIVTNASGCGVMVKDYGHALGSDPAYAAKAARVGELAIDLGELLPELVEILGHRMSRPIDEVVAFHAPCTLQHGQKLRGGIEANLRVLGFRVESAPQESHLCCGSAGAYSVLQPTLAGQLRDRKLTSLTSLAPTVIASANVGCIQHLQSGTPIPVRHWIELLDDALTD